MKRREFITLLGGAVAAWPLVARAQQAGKIYRVGFLANDPTIPTQPAGQAFLEGLRESGFIEGKNAIIERRFAEGRLDQYADLMAELVRLKVDVIVTSANEATLAAKRASINIPVVMMNVADPLGQELSRTSHIHLATSPVWSRTIQRKLQPSECSSSRMRFRAVPRWQSF